MFGYVKPYVPELRVREHEFYRAMYCGLCRAMGAVTGQLSRFTLSYDFVFLAAVRLLLTGETPEAVRIRCPVHPLSRRSAVADNEAFRYTAAVSAALFSAKLDDNVTDERGAKRFIARLIRPAARHMVKKSGVADVCADFDGTKSLSSHSRAPEGEAAERNCRHCPETEGAERNCRRASEAADGKSLSAPEREAAAEACRRISPLLAQLSSLEEEGCTSVDRCASVFGELTACLFSAGLDGPASRIAWEIGAGVGRFIYAADACDDAPEDLKLGRFNPILSAYGSEAVKDGRLTPETAEMLRTAALLDLERTSAAVELACDSGGDKAVAAIVRNIIYLGMPHVLGNIIIGQDAEPQGTV